MRFPESDSSMATKYRWISSITIILSERQHSPSIRCCRFAAVVCGVDENYVIRNWTLLLLSVPPGTDGQLLTILRTPHHASME
jgi:hypothetical protein